MEQIKPKRGRKPTSNPVIEVKLWIHNDAICGGEPMDKTSAEFAAKLDKFKGILTRYAYDNKHLFI